MSRPTPAQASFWPRLRRAVPDAPEQFTPGKYRCPLCGRDRGGGLKVGYDDREHEVTVHCFGGCNRNELRKALGVRWADLRDYTAPRQGTPAGEFTYTDEQGAPLFRVCRWRNPDGQRYLVRDEHGDWALAPRSWKRPGVLYRAPEVARAIEDEEPVYLCATENDADAIANHGGIGTAVPEAPGKGGFRVEYAEALRGAYVRVVATKTEAGRERAHRVADALSGRVADVAMVEPAIVKVGATARDHLEPASGRGLDDFAPLSPSDPAATVPPPPAEPPKLAAELRILDRFRVAVHGCGVVGEDATAATTYLVLTSRLLPRQASLIVKGHSSSGKSYTVEQTVRFFPPEAVIVMTGMSERALIYSPEEYAHRTLVLYEAAALREGQEDNQTAYYVRSLLSEGRISYPVTVKDKDGNFTTRTIVKEGPTNLVMTTTKVAVHAENETRMLSVTTDDSREQTARVFAALADETDSGIDLTEWVQLQRWLAAAEHRVTIPYAARLAELVPPVAVRLRRDFGTLLALIRAHAVLHQQTRERDAAGRIVATTDDYEQVRALVEDVIAAGVGETVSPTVRTTVEAVRALTTIQDPDVEPAHPGGVTARHVATTLELDKSAARRRLQTASAAGYVFNAEDQRGKPGRWKLGEPLPGGTRLLPVESALATAPESQAAGQDDGGTTGGTVALGSWGEDGHLPGTDPGDPGKWAQ